MDVPSKSPASPHVPGGGVVTGGRRAGCPSLCLLSLGQQEKVGRAAAAARNTRRRRDQASAPLQSSAPQLDSCLRRNDEQSGLRPHRNTRRSLTHLRAAGARSPACRGADTPPPPPPPTPATPRPPGPAAPRPRPAAATTP